MPTKVEFADTIILNLGYNDINKGLDRRQVYADADLHLPLILTQWAKNFGDDTLNNFTSRKVVSVVYDTAYDAFSIKLPLAMNLGNYGGIRKIGDTQDVSSEYIMVQTGLMSIASNLECGGMAGLRNYYRIGNVAYLVNPPARVPEKLLVTYVPTFKSLSAEDEINCPAEVLSMLSDKLTDVLMIQMQTPENAVNDNKDDK